MPILHELIVEQYGAFVSKHQGRLRVTVKGERVAEAPLMHLQQVVIAASGVSLSSNVIAACCGEGIPIHFVSSRGEPFAGLYAPGLTGTVLTRREQLLAYHDARGLEISRALARAKILSQAALLRYAGRYRQEADPELYAQLEELGGRVAAHADELPALSGPDIDTARERLLSTEGRAARYYWDAWLTMLPAEYGWAGRVGRGAQDVLNAALNYGYGILYSQVQRAIILAGLDPYAGYAHADRPGKPSLVCDLIEPFRVPAVDRVILGLANRKTTLTLDEHQRLDETTRRLLAERVLERLEKPERYEGKRVALRSILQHDARHLAAYLRGERDAFVPFTASW